MSSPAPIAPEQRASVLDPIDRNAEILFGLFMCLTFTGTMSVATAGREEVRTMLIAAIGCNTAWGLVDSVMFLLRQLVVRNRQLLLVRAVRAATDAGQAHQIIAAELGPLFRRAIDTEGLARIRAEVLALPDVPSRARLSFDDFHAAGLIFLLVFLSTFPLVLPFLVFDDLQHAMRVSAAIAIAMLFLCGYNWGRYAGVRPVRVGLTMVTVGLVVEAAVIALGG
ncbi:MAG: VIT1/CCC1 transporter family protein [Burkholderiaceae bacterium]|nr:VIT1/CCC1 transporter family protein [Burkholderiaceae bacterium]